MDKVRFVLGRDRVSSGKGAEDSPHGRGPRTPGPPSGSTQRYRFDRSALEIASAAETADRRGSPRYLTAPGGSEDVPFGLRRRINGALAEEGSAPRAAPAGSDAVLAAKTEWLRRSMAAVAFDFVNQVMDLSSVLLEGVPPARRTEPSPSRVEGRSPGSPARETSSDRP